MQQNFARALVVIRLPTTTTNLNDTNKLDMVQSLIVTCFLILFLFLTKIFCRNITDILDISTLLNEFQVISPIELLNEFLTIFNFQVLNYNLQIGYDRRVRPNYGNSPVFVKVSLYVLSVEVIVDRVYCKDMDKEKDIFI